MQIHTDEAADLVEGFVARFGNGHLRLALHASLPLGLTPDLLGVLRHNLAANVPWIAEADLLLSQLCRDVGHGKLRDHAAPHDGQVRQGLGGYSRCTVPEPEEAR